MLILTYSDDSIYKKLRHVVDKMSLPKIGIIATEAEFSELFKRRFFANEWNEYSDYFYIIKDFSKIEINNLKNSIDLWNGGIIIDYNNNIPKEYLYIIINFCLKNNLQLYISKKYNIENKDDKKIHFLEDVYEF